MLEGGARRSRGRRNKGRAEIKQRRASLPGLVVILGRIHCFLTRLRLRSDRGGGEKEKRLVEGKGEEKKRPWLRPRRHIMRLRHVASFSCFAAAGHSGDSAPLDSASLYCVAATAAVKER